jgi:predicted dehydrogenase
MAERLAWGIMGCGWVARDYGGPAIAGSRNGRVAALYDPDPLSLARAAALFPGAAAHADLAAFLAVPGLGAAYVAAPNHVHRALVEAAAGAGLAVLCEKPMATALADAEAMVAACARAGVRYATAFDQRFHGAHRAMARLIADGRLGTVTAVRIVYACWLPADWPGAEGGDNWRIDPSRAGGGALMDLAPHGLDLAATLLGEPLVDVVAMGQGRVHRYGVEDGAALVARSRSGALVQMHVAYNCPETLPRRRLEVVGTAGQLVAVDTMGQVGGGTLQLLDARTGAAEAVLVAGIERSPFLNQVEAFADAVLGATPFPFTPENDLATMRLLLRAQEQAAPPGLPHAA